MMSTTNTARYWVPEGSLTPGQAKALAVLATAKPDRQMYSTLMARTLQHLIDQSPETAQDALEMSQEHLPEMHQIARENSPREWAQAVTNSDSMDSLRSRIDWSLPGTVQSLPEQSLDSVLEQMT